MTDASPASGRRRPKWIGLFAACAAGLAVGWWAAQGPTPSNPTNPELARPKAGERKVATGSADAGTAGSPDSGHAPRLEDGALPPILGPPRGATPDFCDDDQWSRLGTIFREFRDGEVVVDESDWVGRSAEARIGMASWVSNCKQAGAPVAILGDDSGEILAVYDSANGYRSGDVQR